MNPLKSAWDTSHPLNVTNTRKTSVRSCSSTRKVSILAPRRLGIFLCSRTRALSWSDNNYRPPKEWRKLCCQLHLSVRHTVYGGRGSLYGPQLWLPSVQHPSPSPNPLSIQDPSLPLLPPDMLKVVQLERHCTGLQLQHKHVQTCST